MGRLYQHRGGPGWPEVKGRRSSDHECGEPGAPTPDSMKDLLHALGERLMESDPDGMMQFWNDDGRYEFPYAPEAFGFPKVVHGNTSPTP